MSTNRLTGALCSTDQHRGLPWTDENPSAASRARMFGVCATCPVAAACAREVATKETTAGFWAGADRTLWRERPVSGLFQDLLTGLPVQGTLPLNLPGLDPDPSEVAA